MTTMDRRKFLTFCSVGTSSLALSTALHGQDSKDNNPDKRPNIIFLLTDDQRWDSMGCMGNPIIQTPNMDNMARNCVIFRNAYVTTPICCASRASLLTGQYARRHGIHNFFKNFSEDALAQTYPLLLRQTGYRTGFVGKYGVGNTDETMPVDKFDRWYGFPGWGTYEQIDENGNLKHLTQIMGEQSIEFLRGCSQKQPFCLSVSFKAPHVQDEDPRQFIPDPAYDDLYKNDTIPLPKTAAPRYFNALPTFLRESEARVRWEIRFSTPEKYQESVKNYYRLVTGVDVVIGQIRKELEKLKLDDNTVILLMGDNGFYLGEHGLAGKWYGHEESIRVPLVMYDPRLPANRRGQERPEMALNIDIAPTLLSLAGAPVPGSMQGRNLMPLVNGKAEKWRSDFFFEHLFAEHPLIPKSEGVVTERYKYLCYFEQQPVYEELYDVKNDPYEEKNLAIDSRYHPILEKLRKRCGELRKAAD